MQNKRIAYLEMLLDYDYERNPSLNINSITPKKVEKLIKKNKVACIFGIIEKAVMEPWYFIVSENDLCYVLSKSDDEYMDYLVGCLVKIDKNKYIEIERREIDFIYTFENAQIINRVDGTKVKVLEEKQEYSFIEWIENKKSYVIAYNFDKKSATWKNGEYFDDIIKAVINYQRFY